MAPHDSMRGPHVQRGNLVAPFLMALQHFVLRHCDWRGKKGLAE
jgi:hypothetical protein